MNIHIDYRKRLARIRELMGEAGMDVFIGTRTVSLSFVAGAFIPWRSAVLVTRDGYEGLVTLLLDSERLRNESWMTNIQPYAPIAGMDLWDVIVNHAKKNGWDKATVGVELGHSPRGNTGYLFATEYELLRNSLPEANFVNALSIMDRASVVKDPGEIKLLRQAAAIADAAMERVKESIYPGATETEIAGIGEMELRRLGSEYHWAVTGSSEVASGYRACYAMNGTTQPTDKIVKKGENIIVDLHPYYHLYTSDLSHNFILGEPNEAQRRLSDAYVQTAQTIIDNFKAGNRIGDIHAKVLAKAGELGYGTNVIPSFGHGLGVLGHEWYPAILANAEFRDVVLEENSVEVAFLAMTVPGVCGMRLEYPVLVTANGGEPLCATPLELTVLEC
ncbi:MAG: aminopeptidase P family protein [Spirochaetes bacterium]|nr:aminopeptidase P family protein [Spirochaetota bacterium]